MLNTNELRQVGGLWVPAAEAHRYAGPKYTERSVHTGTIDLGADKAAGTLKFCSKRAVAVDIGAHVGAVSLMLAKFFQNVVAFEPVPAAFASLTANTRGCGNVTCHQIALSSRARSVFFEVLPDNFQLSHAVEADETMHFKKSQRVGPVEARTLDSFDLRDVTFIKIDVEGDEGEVVYGARETILRERPLILIEQAGNEQLYHARPRDEAIAFLASLGMKRVNHHVSNKDQLYGWL